jgi:hypothetical protein
MGTEPGTALVAMRCQVKGNCTHQASYVLSGGVSDVIRDTCALHLAEAIDDALGQPILTPGRQPMAWPSVTVRRHRRGPAVAL